MRWITFGWLSLIFLLFPFVRTQSQVVIDCRQQGDSSSLIWAYFGLAALSPQPYYHFRRLGVNYDHAVDAVRRQFFLQGPADILE
jgi:hypothetical protein